MLTARWISILVVGAGGILAGCHHHVYRAPPPVRTEQVIEMSRAGEPPERIIETIEKSRTIYYMDSQDVVDLKEQGVDKRVIDHMMRTAEREAERRAQRARAVRYYRPYPDPYLYWGPGFGFYYGPW